MTAFLSVPEQLEVITRGVVDNPMGEELATRLTESAKTGAPLRVKAGFDPTRPDLHLGHAVLLTKLRQFQDLGHQAILLVGDFTALVGDPTGQNDLRPRLTRDEVAAAAKTYTDQAFRILDAERTEVRFNSEWLGKMTSFDMVELLAKQTVSRMLERNDFALRHGEGRPIWQHEFLYPLLQGYDSVALQSDLELGGTDQLFNLLMGRDLQGKYGQRGQMVLTVPILEGTDAKVDESGKVVGKKMSKSAGNYVGLREAPAEMYRKMLQIDDQVVWRYFELLSAKSRDAIAELRATEKNPMTVKGVFAKEMITRFHSAEDAEKAEAEFKRVYSGDAVPENVPVFEFSVDGAGLWLPKALADAQLVKSTSDGRRLVEQGGVEVDGARASDPKAVLPAGEYLVRVGSKQRRFARIVVR
jgi:tyrosyl-tRNA synthetase